MRKYRKTGLALMVSAMLALVYPISLALKACTPFARGEITLSFELNDYYWDTQEVHSFCITNLLNSGIQERDILIVDLTVTNESSRSAPLMSWYVIDVEEQRFESTIASDISFEEDISVEVIGAGETIRGKVAFEVPPGNLPLWIHCAKYTVEAKIQ